MSSPCLSGGGRTYGFDLEIVVKSPSTSTRTSQTSSPSSTLSESSNSQLAISTRKSRTPRKRPNQTYNEAAALLSTAYPKVFSTKNLSNPRKSTKLPHDLTFFYDDSADQLLLPFRVIDSSGFLLHQPTRDKPVSPQIHPRFSNLGEVDFQPNSKELDNLKEVEDDFDAESILDEEIEEGIDSIMGDLSVDGNVEVANSPNFYGEAISHRSWDQMGWGLGGRFEFGMGLRSGRSVRAMRRVDDGNWWCFPPVDVREISPRLNKPLPVNSGSVPAEKKKKKVEKPAAAVETKKPAELPQKENPVMKSECGLLLKLNYEEILNAWSDRGSPFSEELSGSDSPGNDVAARLAQIDLFSDGGGLREASVMRYKEKRRTRLFSKKIRYQVRKVNADRRPRSKGRFVRRPSCSTNGQRS